MHSYFSDKLTVQQVSKIPFFDELPSNIIEEFIGILKVQKFRKGDYVFAENDEALEMYFILDGSVSISKKTFRGTKKVLVELKESQFFGEMALIDKGKRSTSAIASTDLTLAVLSWNKLGDAFESYNPELLIYTYKKIAQALSLRLRQVNALYVHSI